MVYRHRRENQYSLRLSTQTDKASAAPAMTTDAAIAAQGIGDVTG